MISLQTAPTTAPEDISKSKIEKQYKKLVKELFELQHLLYANSQNSLLIILQGLDAAGKDSTIRHVFSNVNPTGCNVKSFKKPTEEELMYGFLWRIYKHLPAKGMIQIFNRSHYEDILVPTVHQTASNATIEHRYNYINHFEKHLQQQGTIILKFFLNLSEEKQNEKLTARLTDPSKMWKYDIADTREKHNRKAYIETYEQIFQRCSPDIPWHIISADDKWYRNYVVAKTVVDALKSLNMTYPARK